MEYSRTSPEIMHAVCGLPSYFPDQRLVRTVTLPTIPSRIHHYLNLTNGLEATPRLVEHVPPSHISFVRWQSSHCEASRPDLLLRDLPTAMLLQLAQGRCVLVYDFGSRNKKRGVPRALWMGLEFVKWALGRVWFGRAAWSEKTNGSVWVRGANVQQAWEDIWRRMDPQLMKKLKYYRRYLREDMRPDIQLYGVYADTTHDSDAGYYLEMARWFDGMLDGGVNYDDDDDGVNDDDDDDGVGCAGRGRMEVSDAFREALARGEPIDGRYAGEVMHPVEEVLGYRLFLGGVSCVAYEAYMERFSGERRMNEE